MIGPRVKTFLVEIGDPHIDEAHCSCGAKKKGAARWELMAWSFRHNADHLDPLIQRDQDGHALIGKYSARCDDLRSQLSGWHFAKEALTESEREILHVAEQLMDELDRQAGGYLQ